MKYERKQYGLFTLAQFIFQIKEYVKENGKIPDKIILPPEEYVFLTFFRMNKENYTSIIPWDNFNGISLEVTMDKQEFEFSY